MLNDDGDTISLYSEKGRLLSSCKKILDQQPVVTRDKTEDVLPMSTNQVAANLSIILCYLRIAMVVSMSIYGDLSTTFFISAFLLSLALDALGREASSRVGSVDILNIGLSSLCDVLFLLVSYLSMMRVLTDSSLGLALAGQDGSTEDFVSIEIQSQSYIGFMTTFFCSVGKIFDSRTILSLMHAFLAVDFMAHMSHVLSLFFQKMVKYDDFYTRYRDTYPIMLTIMETGQCWFLLKFYMLTHTNTYSGSSSVHHNFALCCFLFMRGLNAMVVVSSIQQWSHFEVTDSSVPEIDQIDADIRDILGAPDPLPQLHAASSGVSVEVSRSQKSSPPRSYPAAAPVPSAVVSVSRSTKVSLSTSSTQKVGEHHHRGESHVQSNYSLRDGSSLSHNPDNPFVIHDEPRPVAGKAATSKKRTPAAKSTATTAPEESSPRSAPGSHHHHRGESHIQSDYSLRDGSSLSHNPHNQYVIHDEESTAETTSGKKRKTVSIAELPVKTPRKSPSNTKNRKKTPAKAKETN